jgi:hypothetical protein
METLHARVGFEPVLVHGRMRRRKKTCGALGNTFGDGQRGLRRVLLRFKSSSRRCSVNARYFSLEILQQIEVGSPAVVEANQFAIHDRALGQIGQRLDYVGKPRIGYSSSHRALRYSRRAQPRRSL